MLKYTYPPNLKCLSSPITEILNALRNVENGVVRGHPSLWAMSIFDRAHTTSYSSLIETVRVSCTVYEIKPSIGPKSHYFNTPLVFNAPGRGVSLRRSS